MSARGSASSHLRLSCPPPLVLSTTGRTSSQSAVTGGDGLAGSTGTSQYTWVSSRNVDYGTLTRRYHEAVSPQPVSERRSPAASARSRREHAAAQHGVH